MFYNHKNSIIAYHTEFVSIQNIRFILSSEFKLIECNNEQYYKARILQISDQ